MKTETREQVADLLLWSDENARNLMEKIAAEHGVSPDVLADLAAWEREQQERIRKPTYFAALNASVTCLDAFSNSCAPPAAK